MDQRTLTLARSELDAQGIPGVAASHWNYPAPVLYEEAVRRGEGVVAKGGAFVVHTGLHTGRSAKDKFIVREPSSEDNIAWGAVNKPMRPEVFDALRTRMIEALAEREVFVQDCWAGADPAHRLGVRVITETAWHSLFARNMFIAPDDSELRVF